MPEAATEKNPSLHNQLSRTRESPRCRCRLKANEPKSPYAETRKNDQPPPPQLRADAGQPALRRQNALWRTVHVAGSPRQAALPDARWRARIGRTEREH